MASATRLLFRGQRQRRAGRPAEAVEALDRARELAPDSPHVTLHRALALADAGRLDDALDALAHAARRWPANPVFPLFRGGLLAEHGRLDEAEAALAAARRLSPNNLLATAWEAFVAMRRGEVEAPLRRLGAVGLTDNPRALAAILTEAEAALFRRFGPDTDPPPPNADDLPSPDERLRRLGARRLAALGQSRLEKGDPVGAWPCLLAAAEKDPSQPDIFAHLGFAAFDLGMNERALDYLGRVGTWGTALDAVHLHRGACLYRLRRYSEALDALQAAAAADELGNFTAWIQLYLGRTLVALGQVDEARPYILRLVEVEGDLALARLRQMREMLGLGLPATAPPGYQVIDEGRTILVVKPPFAAVLRDRPSCGTAALGGDPDSSPPAPAGRAPMQRIALPDGSTALIRHCHRGGLLARLLGDKHFDANRFLREIAISDALRRRGIPTPEILGGVRHEVVRGVYRAEIIVREIPHALDLAAVLGSESASSHAALAASATLLRQIHDAGLFHPDLNAKNILILPDGTAMILDLDRAELLDELPLSDRMEGLARLYRSFHKLGLAPSPVSDAAWATFYATYAGDDETLRSRAAALISRCRRELRYHQFWWRLSGGRRRDDRATAGR